MPSLLRNMGSLRLDHKFADRVNARIASTAVARPIPSFTGGVNLTIGEVLLGLGSVSSAHVPGTVTVNGTAISPENWAVVRFLNLFDLSSTTNVMRLVPAALGTRRRATGWRNEQLGIGVAAALIERLRASGRLALGDTVDVDAHQQSRTPIELFSTTGKHADLAAIDAAGKIHAIVECKGTSYDAAATVARGCTQVADTRLAGRAVAGPKLARYVMGQETRTNRVCAIALAVGDDRIVETMDRTLQRAHDTIRQVPDPLTRARSAELLETIGHEPTRLRPAADELDRLGTSPLIRSAAANLRQSASEITATILERGRSTPDEIYLDTELEEGGLMETRRNWADSIGGRFRAEIANSDMAVAGKALEVDIRGRSFTIRFGLLEPVRDRLDDGSVFDATRDASELLRGLLPDREPARPSTIQTDVGAMAINGQGMALSISPANT